MSTFPTGTSAFNFSFTSCFGIRGPYTRASPLRMRGDSLPSLPLPYANRVLLRADEKIA